MDQDDDWEDLSTAEPQTNTSTTVVEEEIKQPSLNIELLPSIIQSDHKENKEGNANVVLEQIIIHPTMNIQTITPIEEESKRTAPLFNLSQDQPELRSGSQGLELNLQQQPQLPLPEKPCLQLCEEFLDSMADEITMIWDSFMDCIRESCLYKKLIHED